MRALFVAIALSALWAAPARAGMRPRYGGELRVVLPALPQAWDPALAASAPDLAAARLAHQTLLTLATDGTLAPGLLAAVPEPESGGRLFRLKLRAGMRFQDGSAITAKDVAASLSRVLSTQLNSPFAAALLPVAGSADPAKVSGIAVAGELDLQVTLAFPYPDWPKALAHSGLAVTAEGRAPGKLAVGAGAFAPLHSSSGVQLRAFTECPAGRAFVDSVKLSAGDARTASKALSLGEADVAAGSGQGGSEGPALVATYLALNAQRLGPRAEPLRAAVEAVIDVADLTRFFVRAPAAPMYGLLPPALETGPVPRLRPNKPTISRGPVVRLLIDESAADQRSVAERLQVKLYDFGVETEVKRLPRAEFAAALAARDYDLALIAVATLPDAGLALAQLVAFATGRDAAREELKALGAPADAASRRAAVQSRAAQLRQRLPLVPLYAQALRLQARPNVALGAFDGTGAPALADSWLLPATPR